MSMKREEKAKKNQEEKVNKKVRTSMSHQHRTGAAKPGATQSSSRCCITFPRG